MDRESKNGGIALRKYLNWKGALVGGRKLNLSEWLLGIFKVRSSDFCLFVAFHGACLD